MPQCSVLVTLIAEFVYGMLFMNVYNVNIGFGGLGVACWPLVPKFAGSNPAEAIGFLGRKNPQHAYVWRGSKAVSPM